MQSFRASISRIAVRGAARSGRPVARICEPAGRCSIACARSFPTLVAVALPLAGAILAVVRYADGDRDEGLRLAAAALLGLALYALVLL